MSMPADVVSIIGASGSGKTTLLRCVDLLEEFDAGEIRLDGEPLGYRSEGGRRLRLKGRELARQRARMGMVFQSYNLFPHLTALRNVMLGPDQGQAAAGRGGARHRRTLARPGRPRGRGAIIIPPRISGGQQQRVAIARALAMEPRLLLLDEVTSALDPELVQEVLMTIRGLAEAGTTMLIVTHEMRFARQVSTRTVFMDHGAIVEEGDPAIVFGEPNSRRLQEFLSSMAK